MQFIQLAYANPWHTAVFLIVIGLIMTAAFDGVCNVIYAIRNSKPKPKPKHLDT